MTEGTVGVKERGVWEGAGGGVFGGGAGGASSGTQNLQYAQKTPEVSS